MKFQQSWPSEVDMISRRRMMAEIAEDLASKPINGNDRDELENIIKYFDREDKEKFFAWCAAFVYHCSLLAGYNLPTKYPHSVRYRFASVHAWQEWSQLPEINFYHPANDCFYEPARGDIVIYDNIDGNGPHDHIGIVVDVTDRHLITAEGNVNNMSGIFERSKAEYVSGYIRIQDEYCCRVD